MWEVPERIRPNTGSTCKTAIPETTRIAALESRHSGFMPRAPESLAEAQRLKERALAKLRVQAGELECERLPADQVQAWGAAFVRLRDMAPGIAERIASHGADRFDADEGGD